MKYTDRVLKHPIFIEFTREIKAIEDGRIYCHHELEHAIDVARMAWIYYLEDTLDADAQKKDLFYTAALLHDIGRVSQYQTGVHHSVSGIEPAKQILEDIMVPSDWIEPILHVIAEHADEDGSRLEKDLEYYIAKADHDSRLCFACEAKDSCKWTAQEMNHTVVS